MSFLSSVKGKLLLVVLGALLLLSLASVYTTSRLIFNLKQYDEVIHITLSAQKLALEANVEFKRQVQEWKNTLIRGANPDQMAKYWKSFNDKHASTQAIVKELVTLLNDQPELKKVANQFLSDHAKMQSAYAQGREKFISSKFDIAVGDASVSGIDRAPSAALDELVAKLGEITSSETAVLESSAENNVRLSYLITLVILTAVAFMVYVLINRIVCIPLANVRNALSAVAKGDLTVTSDYYRNDEIGELADSSRHLQAFLHDNVDTMKHTAASLTQAAEHMSSMSDQLGSQAHEQMNATDQVSTAVQELSHSADEVAQNTTQTSEITQQTADKTSESTKTANIAQQRAVSLVADLNVSAEVIKELAENAANVSSVLDVIRGIAEQTNLLALNAAIEAARAGEQGRGFAVVADEVRTLAQRTQDSTAEIEKILDSVKTGADKAVVSMDTGQSRSKEVETEITHSTALLSEISSMVEQINGMNVQIATAANEQTQVTGNISELIQNIHGLSENTTERVSESLQVSNELKALVQQFEKQISRFTL
ncbi:methyl-accepting chemotaxis protein [Reinekea sp. G2M2-21]|uniref:methyl-accepting chemotaxis protein n=1 Tax=Reinekea sp. G2M2-21 TaxID=2788942 RepID=UPI0018A93C86|nr:methyl-accepting chemotaxis protein [Reinekea sp. G2M2-21]